jgi:hypothetical protein
MLIAFQPTFFESSSPLITFSASRPELPAAWAHRLIAEVAVVTHSR